MTDALRQLIEAAEAGNPRLEHIKNALPNFPTVWDEFLGAFRGDLNAAGRLHDALLAGWALTLALDCSGNCSVVLISQENRIEVTCDDQMKPAGAWLLAILRARLSEADQGRTPGGPTQRCPRVIPLPATATASETHPSA